MSEQIKEIITDEALKSLAKHLQYPKDLLAIVGEDYSAENVFISPSDAEKITSIVRPDVLEAIDDLSQKLKRLAKSMKIANRVIITANEIVWHSIPRRSKTKRNIITPKMAFGKSLTRHMRYNYTSARGINRLNRLVK